MNIVIVGAGRAGTSLAKALSLAGPTVQLVHHNEIPSLHEADAVVLCVPDDAIATVAATLPPTSAVVMHVAGSRTLEVLTPHARVASMHPLVALPNEEIGTARLAGATFAVAGDPLARTLVELVGGKAIDVADEDRAAYHAAACVAANHLVTLLASVGEIAASIGMELEDFLPLAQNALSDVIELGPLRALTGPAARGDVATLDAHLEAIPESTRPLYVALVREALALGEQRRAGSPA